MDWKIKLKGGPFDGTFAADLRSQGCTEPQPVLVAWRCADDPDCEAHYTFNPGFEAIELKTATAYKRVELRPAAREADYEVGDGDPGGLSEREEFELIGAGAGYPVYPGMPQTVGSIMDVHDDGTVTVRLT